MDWIIAAIPDAISLSIVFLLGCIGETINEKSGNLNLGVPGVMCFGAVGGAVGSLIYMNTIYKVLPVNPMGVLDFGMIISYLSLVIIGIFFAVLFGAIAGGIFAFLTTTLKANQNVTGLALTTFGAGFADFVMALLRNDTTKPLFKTASNIIRIGLPDPDINILVYIAFALAVVAFIVLNKTRIGLSVRSIGENPATADAAGINTDAYKYGATLVGCGIAGFGGFFYLMSHTAGTWENSSTLQGYGWMVLALVIFTIWNPLIAIAGSIIFGFLSVSPYFITGVGFVQMEILKMLPYLVTVIVLVITSIVGKKDVTPPDALGMNYFREER